MNNHTTAISHWPRIIDLHRKLLFWFYQRQQRARARKVCVLLAKLLDKADPEQEAIRGQECRSLIWEVKGNLDRAIQHREREIALIKKLWKVSEDSPAREQAIQGYGPADLADRLDLLAVLYHDAGDLKQAIRVLRQSKRLCETVREPFDGADLLKDYLAEHAAMRKKSLSIRRKPA